MAGSKDYNLLQVTNIDTVLQVPDFQKLKQQRQQRNNTVFKKLEGHGYEKTELPEIIIQNEAAKRIQRIFRGYLGRKIYLNLLYENALQNEEKFYKQQQQQVQEGELLIENYKIERELEDTDFVSRNKTRLAYTNATIIQRAWREYKKPSLKEHICCACNDYYPDLYEYYSETQTICFCCEKHRNMTNKERILLAFDDQDFVENIPENRAGLPSSSVDWLSIRLAINNKSEIEDEYSKDLRNKNDSNQDLTFADSYRNDIDNNNIEVEICDSNIKLSCIEKVTDFKQKINLEPEECLKINQEASQERNVQEITHNQENFCKKTIKELQAIVQNLENNIAAKNLELLKELMVRDDLYTKHEAFLMDADNVAKIK